MDTSLAGLMFSNVMEHGKLIIKKKMQKYYHSTLQKWSPKEQTKS